MGPGKSWERTGERAVIKLAQKGDAKAFEQLYSAHKGRVYSLCVRMTHGNIGLAEELTQEVFLQAYRKINSFRGESAFSTWLHRITVNEDELYRKFPLKNCSQNRRMLLRKRSSADTTRAWRGR